jgi:hypothetical protein
MPNPIYNLFYLELWFLIKWKERVTCEIKSRRDRT